MNTLLTIGKLENAPSEFRVFPYGEVELEGPEKIRFVVDHESIASIISDFQRRGNDMVIDYEHQSLKSEEAPAAGWVTKLIDRGKDGLWAAVTWTLRAKNYLKAREYRYFSPVFHIRKFDKKAIKIINIALTNNPRTNAIKPIVAKSEDILPLGQDLRRLHEMMGLTEENFMEAAGNLAPDVKLFETDQEKLQRMFGDI